MNSCRPLNRAKYWTYQKRRGVGSLK